LQNVKDILIKIKSISASYKKNTKLQISFNREPTSDHYPAMLFIIWTSIPYFVPSEGAGGTFTLVAQNVT
jgi:hypothetical protein